MVRGRVHGVSEKGKEALGGFLVRPPHLELVKLLLVAEEREGKPKRYADRIDNHHDDGVWPHDACRGRDANGGPPLSAKEKNPR